MKLVLVVGLPASGKSWWARQQATAARARGRVEHVLDDPRIFSEVREALARARSEKAQSLYIVDPAFCDASVLQVARRQLALEPDLRVCEVFFQNDLVQCEANAVRRGLQEKSVLGALQRWSAVYRPPSNAMPVHKP